MLTHNGLGHSLLMQFHLSDWPCLSTLLCCPMLGLYSCLGCNEPIHKCLLRIGKRLIVVSIFAPISIFVAQCSTFFSDALNDCLSLFFFGFHFCFNLLVCVFVLLLVFGLFFFLGFIISLLLVVFFLGLFLLLFHRLFVVLA